MQLFQQEKAKQNAATRHERLFELIRQDNLAPKKTPGFLQKTRALSAQEEFRTMACNSLRRAS